ASPANRELLSTASAMFAGCHALDPDDSAAGRLRSALTSLLPAPDRPLPGNTAQFNLCFWACDTALAALAQRGSNPQRSAELADALSIALSGTIDRAAPRAERERIVRELTVLAGYRRSEEHTSELQSPCNLVCR